MRTGECIGCSDFPCADVNQAVYQVPSVDIDPSRISIILISEAAPSNPADYYYAGETPFYVQTTVQMFQDAGEKVNSVTDILNLGVYLTTAVKCGKIGYNISTQTIQTCAKLLQKEIALFPQAKAYLLMGDVAIKAFNAVAKLTGEPRVIPAGPTYKIRKGEFYYQGKRAYPSYLQVGPSFFIEKGKHQVVSADIAAALAWARK